jgi:imidazolonepropionase-like amidohydrolase
MSRHKNLALPLALVAVAILGACSKSDDRPLAITHVTVIDATGAPPRPDMTVVVVGHRISAIDPSSSASIPFRAQTIDATGNFLIPGLVDSHLHLTGAGEPNGSRQYFLPLLLANGITTVRDMGGYLESLVPLRREIRSGKRLGPQIFFAGPYLDGDPPSFQPSLVVTNAPQVVTDIQTLVQKGVDFIKVQSTLSRDAYFAIAETCRREHITFVGHVPDRVTAAEASDAGQKSIEHLTGVLRACSTDEPALIREQLRPTPKNESPRDAHTRELAGERELLAMYSPRNADALIAKFSANHTWQVPTLILLRNDVFSPADADLLSEALLRFVPRGIAQEWPKARQENDQFATPQEFALRADLLARFMQLVGRMQSAGVRILAGTDTAAPYLVPGFALHQELVLLVQSGLTPMQALQGATQGPAELLGKLPTQGTVEPGKFADLLLLDANPLDDIRNTQKIRAVVLRGKLLDRAALDALLSSVEKFAATN